MREVELKSVVDDVAARRSRLERGGATLVFAGRLLDVRYDSAALDLVARDHVLRLRVYGTEKGGNAYIDWKGETRFEGGYKVRDELSSPAGNAAVLEQILANLGFVVIREIEREIAQYELDGAIVRFEQYPRMDPLVEVEGAPPSIEKAIAVLGMPREGFTAERLPDFVARYEMRTGRRAALSGSELAGEYSYRQEDA